MNNLMIVFSLMMSFWSLLSSAQFNRPLLTDTTGLRPVNRNISVGNDNRKRVIHINAKPGNGVVWIDNSHFSTGVIEADLKGKNVPQQSFVGIAFDGSNDSTYQAVYFRPFNFRSQDPVRKKHAVQYIFLPSLDWSFLREKYSGKYENSLNHPPDPDSWFHLKIVVNARKIEVFVDREKRPSLIVGRLPGKGAGKLGFWVGNNSEGDFANLTTTNQ